MIREHDGYLYGPDQTDDPWVVHAWTCECHPAARWGYFAAYDGCDVTDLQYAGSPTYGERHPDWPSLAVAHPSVRPTLAARLVSPMALTVAERQHLANEARNESARQLDPRTYAAGPHPDGGTALNPDWHTRQERCDRWNTIANWLHPDPWADAEPVPEVTG